MTRKKDAWRELQDLWADTLSDLRHPALLSGRLPAGWEEIEGRPEPGTVRITLRVDKDVAKWFRVFGPGYQGRMNRVLRAYMLARLAELVTPFDLAPKDEAEVDADALALERRVASRLDELRRMRLGPKLSDR